ncbi:MAG TPA: class I tRNA ligase family protein, partial [Coleofasciculaceae cyanobacterium]
TGFDIIFFWVARMTMMAGHFTNQMPFEAVYIHGLVRDENNKKMSKSSNNGIDPLILIEKYGTDALRYTLVKEVAGAGQDIRMEYDRETDESASVQASRNFANKVWNAARLVMMNLDGKTPQELGQPDVEALELSDRWILSRFHQVAQQTNHYLDTYGLGEAAKGLYDFFWGDFCDWYLELAKPRLRQDSTSTSRLVAQQTLAYVYEGVLKLLHPFMPHITEEIWHTLTQKSDEFLALQSYPDVDSASAENRVLETEGEKTPSAIQTVPIPNSQPPALNPSVAQVQHIGNQVAQFLSELPAEVGQFFRNYQRPLLVLGAIALILITLRVVTGVFSAINSVPLVQPTFEVVGLGYSLWFVYRYLILASRRQELAQVTRSLKEQIVGTAQPHQQLEPGEGEAIDSIVESAPSVAKFQKITTIDPELEQQFDVLIDTIRTIRNLRAEAEIKPGVKAPVILQTANPAELQILEAGQSYIQDLGKVEHLTITPALEQDVKATMAGVVGTVQVLIPLAGVVDVDARSAKLKKDLAKVEAEVKSLSARLANQNFVSKAPEEIVQGVKESLAEAQKQAEILRDRLNRLATEA